MMICPGMPSRYSCQNEMPNRHSVNQMAAMVLHIRIDTMRKVLRGLNQMELNTSQTTIEIGTAKINASRCGG